MIQSPQSSGDTNILQNSQYTVTGGPFHLHNGTDSPYISIYNTLGVINPRLVATFVSSATPSINTDKVNYFTLSAQAVDITSFTTFLTGTPSVGQQLHIAITGTAARAITWGTSFESSATPLPTTTVSTNRLDVDFVWNDATSKWRCVGSSSSVTSIIAGTGITISPSSGTGNVTISATNLQTGTISNNNAVTCTVAPGTDTDTTITHGLGYIPSLVTISCNIFAAGSTYGAYSAGTVSYVPTGTIANGSFSGFTWDGATTYTTWHTSAGQNINAQGIGGGFVNGYHSVIVSILSIGATTFTFRIHGTLVGTSPGNSTVTGINWTAF